MLCFRASGACVFLNDVKTDPRDAATSMVPQQSRLLRLGSASHKGLDHDCGGMVAL